MRHVQRPRFLRICRPVRTFCLVCDLVCCCVVMVWHCSRGMFSAVGVDLRIARLFVRELYKCAVWIVVSFSLVGSVKLCLRRVSATQWCCNPSSQVLRLDLGVSVPVASQSQFRRDGGKQTTQTNRAQATLLWRISIVWMAGASRISMVVIRVGKQVRLPLWRIILVVEMKIAQVIQFTGKNTQLASASKVHTHGMHFQHSVGCTSGCTRRISWCDSPQVKLPLFERVHMEHPNVCSSLIYFCKECSWHLCLYFQTNKHIWRHWINITRGHLNLVVPWHVDICLAVV